MRKIIAFGSGKGGVGKTTTVSNIGAALNDFGKDVIIVDGNLTTPNISLHFGIPLAPVTLHDVLSGQADLEDALYHHPTGIKILPGSIATRDLKFNKIMDLGYALRNLHADFILLDCAAGLGKEAEEGMRAANDIVLVTEPELPAVTDALKAKKLASEFGKNVSGVVLNKFTPRSQLSEKEVTDMLDLPIIATIPHDHRVQKSIAKKRPLVHHKPNAPASIAFRRLAGSLVGVDFKPGFFARFAGLFL